jgi:hypothetical protein
MPRKKATTSTKSTTRTTKTPKKVASKKTPTPVTEAEMTPQESSTPLSVTSPRNLENYINQKTMTWGIILLVVLFLGYLLYRWAVIAWVDGKPITRFALYNELETRYGQTAKDQLISEALINNEARNRHVTVSEDEVNGEIKKYEEQLGGTDNLKSALQMQGLGLEDFKKNLRIQLVIKKMFADQSVVTDQDVIAYFEENKAQFPPEDIESGTPSANLRDQISDQLKQQKLSETFRKWLDEAQKGTRVRNVQSF